jgi:xylulokinase
VTFSRRQEWVKENLCRDLLSVAGKEGRDVYDLINESAAESPIGARKLLFNPSFEGGSSQEASPHIRGAFLRIDLGHSRCDILRSCMEGIAMNLGIVLDVLRGFCSLCKEMLFVGDGSTSELWRRIIADAYNMNILKTNIGRDTGSLGAAALAAVESGLWGDFSRIDDIHKIQEVVRPIPAHVKKYKKLRPAFEQARASQAALGDLLHGIEL